MWDKVLSYHHVLVNVRWTIDKYQKRFERSANCKADVLRVSAQYKVFCCCELFVI